MRLLLIFALLRAFPAYADAALLGSYHWQMDHPKFGGVSGVELSDDGSRFVAISDRGMFLSGGFDRAGGVVSGISDVEFVQMLGADGAPFNHVEDDSEGIAIAPDGTVHVSFEDVDGVRSFDGVAGRASPLVTDRRFAGFARNSSFEALAITPDGDLWTMPERPVGISRKFPVYRLRGMIWTKAFDIPQRGAFLVTGADVGPDGKLYVLERDFVGIGFATRVRRFDFEGGSEEVVLKTGIRTHDNLEGISVWRDDEGIRLTMVSDDNFRAFQQTQIVEYRLTD